MKSENHNCGKIARRSCGTAGKQQRRTGEKRAKPRGGGTGEHTGWGKYDGGWGKIDKLKREKWGGWEMEAGVAAKCPTHSKVPPPNFQFEDTMATFGKRQGRGSAHFFFCTAFIVACVVTE